MASFWGCVQTYPAQEPRALTSIRRQGYTAICPFFLRERKTHKPRWIERPLFPGYLLVEIPDDRAWGPIRNSPGVLRLLTYGQGARLKPQRVPQSFMIDLLERLPQLATGPRFDAGTLVRFTGGALHGREAIVRWSDAARVGLLFSILNREIELTVELATVSPV